jgi:hypothetical protein
MAFVFGLDFGFGVDEAQVGLGCVLVQALPVPKRGSIVWMSD